MESHFESPAVESRSSLSTTHVVRFIGIVVLIVGLVLAFQVVQKAWELFEDEQQIVSLATKIEEHSNVNAFLNSFVGSLQANMSFARQLSMQQYAGDVANQAPQQNKQAEIKIFNAAYFIAWIITLLLLGLIGRVSFWAIGAGGKLAIFTDHYQKEFKRVLKDLAVEMKRTH